MKKILKKIVKKSYQTRANSFTPQPWHGIGIAPVEKEVKTKRLQRSILNKSYVEKKNLKSLKKYQSQSVLNFENCDPS
jgi:hypothetical protein